MGDSKDFAYAELLQMMREQGGKDNPVTLQLGVMQSSNSVKIGDLLLEAEDLYIADHLVAGYTREVKVPYVSNVEVTHSGASSPNVSLTKQQKITFTDGLKKGDLVAIQKLHDDNVYVILARVVQA